MKPSFGEFFEALTEYGVKGQYVNECKALYDAMTQPEELRPMASAPRDGTMVLFYNMTGYFAIGAWAGSWCVGEFDWDEKECLGWLPLPAAKLPEKEGMRICHS